MHLLLREFKKKHRHVRVNELWKDYPELAGWVLTQKQSLEELSEEQITQLDSLGLFDAKTHTWLLNFASLKIFKLTFGHCDVPARWNKNQELSAWIHRHRGKRSQMASWKSKLLGNIGFRFRIQHKGARKPWDDFIGRLRNYNDRFENCNVPARWKEDLALGQWVVNLRANRDKFSAENVRQLNELGFDWAPIKSQWSQRVRQLRAFKNQHGHCIVPKSDFDLWQWVANVRSRKTKLSSARIRALDRLEFDWTPYDTQWQRRYNELAEFRTRFGHANVPARWPENKALGLWLSDQRAGKESLSQECVRLLDELGVDWDPAGSTWMRHLEELRAFQVNHGHASPLVKSGPLGRWVEAQRALEQKLPEDRKRLLNELGFVWRRYRIKSQKNSPVVLDSPNRRCALAELPPENHPLPEIRIPFQTFDRGDSHTVVQCDIQDRAVSAV